MRYFLGTLLVCISFFANSQDTLVQIRPEVARFFLEKNEENKVHIVKDSLQDILISTLRGKALIQQQLIESYQADSVNFAKLLDNKNQEINNSNKEIKRQKRLKYLGYGIAIVVILLSL